jgi:ABC-type branched-subunit amino acid transport system substrate-binding protein
MSLTGFFNFHDGPAWNGTMITADIINEQGGITVNGQKYQIELIVEDCESTMDGVTAAANRLVYDKGVKFIIGPSAFFAAGAAPVNNPAKVMYVLTWCCNTPGECDATTPYAFSISHATIPSAIAAMKFMKQAYPEVKNVALVTPDDGAIPFVIPAVRDLLATEGLNVVGDTIAYPNEMQDFSPIVAKILSLPDIDGIFQANGLTPHVGAIAKGLREGGNYQPYAASMEVPMAEIVGVAGAAACENVFTVCIATDDPENPPMAQEIIDRTLAQYGEDYSIKFTGANALWIIKDAIETAQSLDPTVVKDKLESMGTVDTIYGTGTLCGNETYGIANHVVAHPLPIQVFKDGQVVPGGWINIGTIP